MSARHIGGAAPAAGSFAERQCVADIPLTGADCFLRAFDFECRRRGRAGHLSQLVLRLGEGFDARAFQYCFEEAQRANPILRAPVSRPVGSPFPVYRTTRPADSLAPTQLHPGAALSGADPGAGLAVASPPLPDIFTRRLNEVMLLERGRLLRADVVPRADGGTDLALTWAHLLFDGFGSERFVEWLAACGEGSRRADDLGVEEGAGLERESAAGSWSRGLRARGMRARKWQAHLATLAAPPLRSLAGPLARTPQDSRHEVLLLRVEETARFLARAREKAGVLTPALFPLAAAMRAHAAVFRARRVSPGSFVVPVVANARPRGVDAASRAIFRTQISMLWLRAQVQETEDLDGLVAVLKTQRLAFVRSGLLDDGLVALDLARVTSRRLYARLVRRTFHGELASFFFAYTGELLPETTRFFGAPIESGFHVPGVPASPGSALVFSLAQGRLSITHVWQHGSIASEERALLRRHLMDDLLGAPEQEPGA